MTHLPEFLSALPTPSVLVDLPRLERNIRQMQETCTRHQTRLRPHIKTHKSVAIARRQLEAGAEGLTVAKVGEAEAMLPSGVRRIFVAHSLVDPVVIPRLQDLAGKLDELVLAVTSEPHAEALNNLLTRAGLALPVWMAVDTGLGREGMRSAQKAGALAARIAGYRHLKLAGLYTHEGQFYRVPTQDRAAMVEEVHGRLLAARDAIDPDLPIWPGCSVTATLMAGREGVAGVRPGAYIFADLALTESTGVMQADDIALTVLSTVIDRPEPGLALVDCGTKTMSSDKSALGLMGRPIDGRDFALTRANEEHGFVEGAGVDQLQIGDKIRWITAHVCPVVNLTDRLIIVDGDSVLDTWPVDARGRVQ